MTNSEIDGKIDKMFAEADRESLRDYLTNPTIRVAQDYENNAHFKIYRKHTKTLLQERTSEILDELTRLIDKVASKPTIYLKIEELRKKYGGEK
jgi:hypothetical protein